MNETFVSVVGLFPMSAITPAMVKAINTVDDDGIVQCSTQTAKKLVRYGLADDRVRGVFLTNAGWNVWGVLPAQSAHATSTRDSGESRMNWRKARVESSRAAAWSCTCGVSGFATSRVEARAMARQHRG